ncbi:polysaccharide pyruvyl transferase family protein [Superficieibacter sp. 1612_C1]|uniref:polysaccharide pyruvyl transferase family protein n=1 Tax=Superficieibacter sp. 1612_C1 TaxID=2780382 RepID=UPI001884423B|nr:polysaccharide pyruvyl transferase family protein [Superficieibacter sp. 1612_C1]
MKIAIFNACESLNVGDQVISDCTLYLLKKYVSENVNCYDVLSGKELNAIRGNAFKNFHYSVKKPRKRSVPKILSTLKYLYKHKLFKKEIIKNKIDAIDNADLIFIGGGHLLIDTAGIFAININDIVDYAISKNKDIFVGMVGVRMPWSLIATFYFKKLLKHSKYITVRDTSSRELLSNKFEEFEYKLNSTMDPAIFVDDVYINIPDRSIYQIGLCIISPSELIRAGSKIRPEDILNFWMKLYAFFDKEKSISVCFFTNGSLQDELFLDEIENLIKINRLPKPRTSDELIINIKSCESLIAQRLHTCLPALSMNKRVLGVKWDDKLEHIFDDLNVGVNMISFNDELNFIHEKIINAVMVSELKKSSAKTNIINGLKKINEENHQ